MGKSSNSRMRGLDALRGIAAIGVMIMHSGYTSFSVDHGYLAVDFFFILSGLVIASAYESKFKSGLGTTTFMTLRLTRLYPVLFIGSLISLLAMPALPRDGLWVPYVFSEKCAVASQFLLVPFICGGEDAFLLNGVYWSISYEFLANTSHSLFINILTTRFVACVLVVLAVCLSITIGPDSLDVGWERTHFGTALMRVGFDYLLGIFIFRTSDIWRPKIPNSDIAANGHLDAEYF